MNIEDEKEIQKAIQNIAFEFAKINKIICENTKKQVVHDIANSLKSVIN